MDIGEEGRRVWNIMFEEKIEEESPVDGILYAIAAQAQEGTIEALSCALGLDPQRVGDFLYSWLERQDNPPDVVSIEDFMGRCAPTIDDKSE